VASERNALAGLLLRQAVSSHQAFDLLLQSALTEQRSKVAVKSRRRSSATIDDDSCIADLREGFQHFPDGSNDRGSEADSLVQLARLPKTSSPLAAIDLAASPECPSENFDQPARMPAAPGAKVYAQQHRHQQSCSP